VRVDVAADAATAAERAAAFLAEQARLCVASRGSFSVALSGGRSPLPMFRALAALPVPWQSVHLFQVDERVAPPGDADRNLTSLESCLLRRY